MRLFIVDMRGPECFLLLLLLFLPSTSPFNVAYTPLTLPVKTMQIPLAIWTPTFSTPSSHPTSTYPYSISIPRIVKLLIGLPLPNFTFMLKQFEIPSSSLFNAPIAHEKPRPLVIVSHGYLGSRFDLTSYCEGLASKGIIAVAPEFPESLSASYEIGDVRREEIVTKTIEELKGKYNIGGIGFLGHSLGTGLTLNYGMGEECPRCAIAGFRGLTDASKNDNILIIASDNDAVCPGSYIRPRFTEASLESPKIKSLFSTRWNHISYLNEKTNECMVDFLKPLLPIARGLKVPLLDFDVYEEVMDGGECGEETVPVVVDFFRNCFKYE